MTTRDDIIRMAQTCGFNLYAYMGSNFDMFTRFAELVAAAEREECAKVCEETRIVKGGEVFSAAIRARGNT